MSNQVNFYLDAEVDDHVRCTNCDFVGLVRLGEDNCPDCNEPCLMDETDEL